MTMKRSAREHKASIKVPLTAGNIRNGHVSVRDHLWFFPKSSIRGQRINGSNVKPCVLELPGHGSIETEIDAEKGIFRWRGWRRFFHQDDSNGGNRQVFSRIERSRFTVKVEDGVLNGSEKVQTLVQG